MLFKNNFEANGVMYKKFDKICKVYASKSVVMSAGTLNTPKILMSSGIGPAHQLEPLKVNEKKFFFCMFLIFCFLNVICMNLDPGSCGFASRRKLTRPYNYWSGYDHFTEIIRLDF